jgi:hypothetical protein
MEKTNELHLKMERDPSVFSSFFISQVNVSLRGGTTKQSDSFRRMLFD